MLLVLALVAARFTPSTPWHNIYCPVAADVEFWSHAACLTTETWFGAPDHLVQDGQLYLRAQSTRHSFLIVTYADAPGWDEQAMARYRAEHPDLVELWPDHPVRWLRR